VTLQPGTRLGPYEILAAIGAGGMGEVYKAHDTRLDRIVAVKRLLLQHGHRFEQEARAIAALNHPHICQVYDVGPDYLVLEYIEGRTIRGPLASSEAVRLAIQIASALEAAHQRGIIHRDLKPANIMVTNTGAAKLLDFGLAKLQTMNADATTEGTVLGTAAYMAPEQTEGKPLDERSDVFSFGAVLYEMLSGRRAFPGTTTLQVWNAVLRDDPPPLQVPPALARVVLRCLAKQSADRFQTMTDVRIALEEAARAGPATLREQQPSIAVLSFANMSADPENEYFSDGLAEEIINALAHIPDLKVIARTSAFAFKGKQEDIRRIAEVLGVAHVLEGSVRRAGNRIRVTAQLIAAGDGSHLWSERYDRELADVFAIQDEIAHAIAETLHMKLVGTSAEARLVSQRRVDPEVYECYLRGRYFWNKRTVSDLRRAHDYFESAIDKDPLYAVAHSGLADTWFYRGYHFGDLAPDVAMPQGKAAALKALAIDEGLAEAHASLALVHFFYDWDMKSADREFQRAIELNPSYVTAHHGYSIYLAAMRRNDDSITEARRALEMDPLSLPILNIVGEMLLAAQRYEVAIEQTRKTLEIYPDYSDAHSRLVDAYTALGRIAEAVDERLTIVALAGAANETVDELRRVFERCGFQSFRERDLELLISRFRGFHWDAYEIACHCARLRKADEALAWLVKACDARSGSMVWTNVHHDFDWLRPDSRFQDLIARVHLPQ
jgi:serine/threonine-protein kinase